MNYPLRGNPLTKKPASFEAFRQTLEEIVDDTELLLSMSDGKRAEDPDANAAEARIFENVNRLIDG